MMQKTWAILWCILFLAALFLLTIGTASNARSYWIEQGNELFNQGNYEEATICYKKAIELGNQTNAPIFTDINIQSRYNMNLHDSNGSSQVFSKISAAPISSAKGQPNPDSEEFTLSFDVSNPNDMHMRIGNIYVDVIKYISIYNPKIIESFAARKTRGYFCSIEPENGSYKCIQRSNDYDYIDLEPSELEHFAINVDTDTPGIYQVTISLEYAIGGKTNRIIAGKAPKWIGFFSKI